MNDLVAKFADKLVILGFPCNQFGHQENADGDEIYNSLKYVRPGNMYEPKFPIMEKCLVNGKDSHPLFEYLRQTLPTPSDDHVSFMNSKHFIIWEPVTRTDIAWNFEKFLISPDGVPYKRYSRYFETINIQKDIQDLIEKYNV